MNHTRSRSAIVAILMLVAWPVLAQDDLPIRNCTWCHGTSAQGYMLAPRLAGQRPQYIENQLTSFAGHLRDNPLSQKYMWNAVARLQPQTAHDLAVHFSSLSPEAAGDGRRELVATGKTIYEDGIAEANVVSCLACHGPNGEGVRQIPRLGGLSYDYLKRRLEQWNEGFHASAKPMPQVARTLSGAEIEALASYLSYVEFASAGQ